MGASRASHSIMSTDLLIPKHLAWSQIAFQGIALIDIMFRLALRWKLHTRVVNTPNNGSFRFGKDDLFAYFTIVSVRYSVYICIYKKWC